MEIILWILFGALAGWLASMIIGNEESQGAVGNIVVGILGAIVGGFLMTLIGADDVDGISLYGLIVAIGGAVLLLYLKQLVTRR